MATTVQPSGASTGSRMQRRPRQNFETWSWFFMRVSGLVLVFMALLHFAITHILYDVADTDAAFVTNRWANPLWRVYDWVLLALGLFHGLNGMRMIIDDYVRSPGKRAAVKASLYSLTGALFLYGTLTVVTFTANP
ncbi:MAG TPA: succinate dehydrogenase hydrophobic membrane anchor subunit [Acidimicrobiales bacterium]|nr:succinate dehydrogenase hydrophobic membrane anchor subunit [Acidimicrobiales bacterium]